MFGSWAILQSSDGENQPRRLEEFPNREGNAAEAFPIVVSVFRLSEAGGGVKGPSDAAAADVPGEELDGTTWGGVAERLWQVVTYVKIAVASASWGASVLPTSGAV